MNIETLAASFWGVPLPGAYTAFPGYNCQTGEVSSVLIVDAKYKCAPAKEASIGTFLRLAQADALTVIDWFYGNV